MDSKKLKQELDIISGLPDSILALIISHLPVDEVVRTSVLAKRWKDSWKYVSRLDINPMQMMKLGRAFVKYDPDSDGRIDIQALKSDLLRGTGLITSIINSIQNEVIHCRIIHFPVNVKSGELKEWVKNLVHKGVRDLGLACLNVPGTYNARILHDIREDDACLELTPYIFRVLESLKLVQYPILDYSSFQSCDKLQFLMLKRVKIADNTLSGILSCCKILKELRLSACRNFKELQIRSRNLKLLLLQNLVLEKLNVFAEALTTLILDKVTCERGNVVINTPRLSEFQAYDQRTLLANKIELARNHLYTEDLLERFSGILACHDGSHPIYKSGLGYISPFKNLRFLSTILDLNSVRHAILLSYIFQVCFRLEKLTIKDRDAANSHLSSHSRLPYREHLFWDKKEVFDCISKYLKIVVVINFRGKVLGMEFLKYVITRALNVYRITIKCDEFCTKEETTAISGLLSLPRASLDVSVVLIPPREELYGTNYRTGRIMLQSGNPLAGEARTNDQVQLG